jgi:hypothetical protein
MKEAPCQDSTGSVARASISTCSDSAPAGHLAWLPASQPTVKIAAPMAAESVWQIISGSDSVFAMHGNEITENMSLLRPEIVSGYFPVICLMKGNASTCTETQYW